MTVDYAMVYKNGVLVVLKNQQEEPFFPPDENGNPVFAIPCDETVKKGMVYDAETGTFKRHVSVSIQDRLCRIEEKIQINEDLQNFYDEIMKEVGL